MKYLRGVLIIVALVNTLFLILSNMLSNHDMSVIRLAAITGALWLGAIALKDEKEQ